MKTKSVVGVLLALGLGSAALAQAKSNMPLLRMAKCTGQGVDPESQEPGEVNASYFLNYDDVTNGRTEISGSIVLELVTRKGEQAVLIPVKFLKEPGSDVFQGKVKDIGGETGLSTVYTLFGEAAQLTLSAQGKDPMKVDLKCK
jgi:hypothetical protein